MLSYTKKLYISHLCPGYNVNKAGNIVGRNYTVKKDHQGGCVSKALKRNYVPLEEKKIFCLEEKAQKVILLLI